MYNHLFKLSLSKLTLLMALLSLVCLLIMTKAQAEQETYIEGQHYTRIVPAVSTDVPADKIEVREFFWYGCPHCYALEPYIEKWTPPKDVVFIRNPALFGPSWIMHGYTYYSLEALKRLDLHEAIFEALHVKRLNLREASDMANFLKQHGVKPDDFRAAMESFQVKTKIKNAEIKGNLYAIRSVPVLAVNGRYLVTTSQFAQYGDVLKVVDYLIKKEQERIQAS